MKRVVSGLLLLGILLFSFGCASNVNLRSFTDPSIESSSVKKVAILPIRNSRILPGESNELLRSITREFVKKNPNVTVLSAVDATDMLNKSDMTEKYSNFLRDYAVSGIPNSKILKEIGDVLSVDAIVQGEVLDIVQRNGYYPGVMALTSLSLRYYMLSTSKGNILWEASCSASQQPGGLATVWTPPVPISDVIILAQNPHLNACLLRGQSFSPIPRPALTFFIHGNLDIKGTERIAYNLIYHSCHRHALPFCKSV
ncbi:MAG: hypothetical protein M0024_10465 [Nitrospiraceae bacterium]|nr:hypothetical protein [Nitrospiraceae bacterium]